MGSATRLPPVVNCERNSCEARSWFLKDCQCPFDISEIGNQINDANSGKIAFFSREMMGAFDCYFDKKRFKKLDSNEFQDRYVCMTVRRLREKDKLFVC